MENTKQLIKSLEKIATSLDRITIALLQLGGSKIQFDVLERQDSSEQTSEESSAD